MKDLLYFTVKRERWSSRISVMRVTRVNSGRRLYGSVDGISCHCLPNCAYGKFETEEQAGIVCRALEEVFRTHETAIKNAEQVLLDARQRQEFAVRAKLEEAVHASV